MTPSSTPPDTSSPVIQQPTATQPTTNTMLPRAKSNTVTAQGTPFALVELFTSEGCSSCPAADDVLNDFQANSASRGVITLSFHVDYWDEIGWPDPWSSNDNTARQQSYARVRGDHGLYTPQMIIDGTDAFVGSDRSRAKTLLATSLEETRPATIALHTSLAGNKLTLTWDTKGAPPGAVLSLAIAQDGLVSHVTRGENAGKILKHDGVVRRFHTVTSDVSHGSFTFDLPGDIVLASSRAVAFVSTTENGPVIGAAASALR